MATLGNVPSLSGITSQVVPEISDFTQPDLSTTAEELLTRLNTVGQINEFSTLVNVTGNDSLTSASQNFPITESTGPTTLDDPGELITDTVSQVMAKLISTVNPDDKIIFKISPTISEERQASYTSSDIVHHPGQLQIYRTTTSRTWSLTATLVSRTGAEASENIKYINLLRSWVQPYYGEGTEANDPGRLGAPPDVLEFSAYGDKIVGKVPVVLTSYNCQWPNSIDWIKSEEAIPFPIMMDVSISLTESYSPKEYSKFSLSDYKLGNLSKAYGQE